MEKSSLKIIPGAGPFYYDGNDEKKTGILMIPGGGGGTCADLKPLAEDLNREKGYVVHVPLLPGFGTTPEDLRNATISAWKEALYKELDLIKQKCERVIVGGHSLGGVFTLILAGNNDLDGIFTISAPTGLRGIAPKLVPIVKFFMKYHAVSSEELKKETNGKWVGYDKIPLNVVAKYKNLINEMKVLLPEIQCPAILFQGRLDSVIKKSSMDEIFKKIWSKKKIKIWLENNDHPILCCPDHEQIVSELINFIDSI
ncbi:MAG: alpha/beta hydrolase [Promethearchaeota archaeon]